MYKITKIKMAFLATMALLLSGTAWAVDPGWYGNLGLNYTEYSEDEFDRICDDLGFRCTADNGQTGFRGGVGYKVNPYFSIEGGYTSLAEVEYKALLGDLTYELDGPYAALIGEIPLGQGGFSLLGTLGFAYLDSRVSSSLGGGFTGSVKEDEFVPVYGLGGAFNSSSGKFSVRLMWERVDVDEFYRIGGFGFDTPEVDVFSLQAIFKLGGS